MNNQNCLRRVFILFGRLASNGIRMEIGSFGITFNVNNLPIGFFDGLKFSSTKYDEITEEEVKTKRQYLIQLLQSEDIVEN